MPSLLLAALGLGALQDPAPRAPQAPQEPKAAPVPPASALVVPLHEGGGTRFKVIEALALGLPVVSTPKGVEGLDAYLATTVAKPLPNPTSTVEPVVDPEPTTTTTTGTTTSTPAPATKPATTTPTKPVSNVGTKVSSAATTSAVSTDAVAKKPIAKKKGTR